MPDRDVFPGLHRSWRRVGRAVCGRQAPEAVGALGEKALAEQLRNDRVGPAKLREAASAIVQAGTVEALRHVVDPSDLQASDVLRCLQAIGQAPAPRDKHELIESTLVRVAHQQIETLRPRLVGHGMSVADANRYLDECAAGIRIGLLADQVATGRDRIRAPRRARARTADLLHESLT